jgi:ferredoxin
MKLMVNGFACDGHAQCTAAAPGAFRLGTDGKAYGVFIEVPADQQDAVRDAQRRCPQRAVLVLEEPG